jgi:Protein of unknown function (DUF2786)
MTEDKHKHKEKVRRLLALASHPDTPAGEKETAFARAAALMLKHEIEQADLEQTDGEAGQEDIVLYDHPVTGRGGRGPRAGLGTGRGRPGNGM